jgi:hypothetical protein
LLSRRRSFTCRGRRPTRIESARLQLAEEEAVPTSSTRDSATWRPRTAARGSGRGPATAALLRQDRRGATACVSEAGRAVRRRRPPRRATRQSGLIQVEGLKSGRNAWSASAEGRASRSAGTA